MEILSNLALQAHDLILQMPYLWIFILMTIESTILPLPSEIVMIPAWYFVAMGKVNFVLAFLSWVLWSLAWAMINYTIWYYWWSKLIKRLIWEKYNDICVNYFEKHWDITTLIWRLLPWIRHLVSLPAWVFKMDLMKFTIYTCVWSAVWVLILMLFWYYVWENKELFMQYKYHVVLWSVVVISIIVYIKIKIIQYLQKK